MPLIKVIGMGLCRPARSWWTWLRITKALAAVLPPSPPSPPLVRGGVRPIRGCPMEAR